MKDEKFYAQLEEELDKKQNIVSALQKILKSFEIPPKLPEQEDKKEIKNKKLRNK